MMEEDLDPCREILDQINTFQLFVEASPSQKRKFLMEISEKGIKPQFIIDNIKEIMELDEVDCAYEYILSLTKFQDFIKNNFSNKVLCTYIIPVAVKNNLVSDLAIYQITQYLINPDVDDADKESLIELIPNELITNNHPFFFKYAEKHSYKKLLTKLLESINPDIIQDYANVIKSIFKELSCDNYDLNKIFPISRLYSLRNELDVDVVKALNLKTSYKIALNPKIMDEMTEDEIKEFVDKGEFEGAGWWQLPVYQKLKDYPKFWDVVLSDIKDNNYDDPLRMKPSSTIREDKDLLRTLIKRGQINSKNYYVIVSSKCTISMFRLLAQYSPDFSIHDITNHYYFIPNLSSSRAKKITICRADAIFMLISASSSNPIPIEIPTVKFTNSLKSEIVNLLKGKDIDEASTDLLYWLAQTIYFCHDRNRIIPQEEAMGALGMIGMLSLHYRNNIFWQLFDCLQVYEIDDFAIDCLGAYALSCTFSQSKINDLDLWKRLLTHLFEKEPNKITSRHMALVIYLSYYKELNIGDFFMPYGSIIGQKIIEFADDLSTILCCINPTAFPEDTFKMKVPISVATKFAMNVLFPVKLDKFDKINLRNNKEAFKFVRYLGRCKYYDQLIEIVNNKDLDPVIRLGAISVMDEQPKDIFNRIGGEETVYELIKAVSGECEVWQEKSFSYIIQKAMWVLTYEKSSLGFNRILNRLTRYTITPAAVVKYFVAFWEPDDAIKRGVQAHYMRLDDSFILHPNVSTYESTKSEKSKITEICFKALLENTKNIHALTSIAFLAKKNPYEFSKFDMSDREIIHSILELANTDSVKFAQAIGYLSRCVLDSVTVSGRIRDSFYKVFEELDTLSPKARSSAIYYLDHCMREDATQLIAFSKATKYYKNILEQLKIDNCENEEKHQLQKSIQDFVQVYLRIYSRLSVEGKKMAAAIMEDDRACEKYAEGIETYGWPHPDRMNWYALKLGEAKFYISPCHFYSQDVKDKVNECTKFKDIEFDSITSPNSIVSKLPDFVKCRLAMRKLKPIPEQLNVHQKLFIATQPAWVYSAIVLKNFKLLTPQHVNILNPIIERLNELEGVEDPAPIEVDPELFFNAAEHAIGASFMPFIIQGIACAFPGRASKWAVGLDGMRLFSISKGLKNIIEETGNDPRLRDFVAELAASLDIKTIFPRTAFRIASCLHDLRRKAPLQYSKLGLQTIEKALPAVEAAEASASNLSEKMKALSGQAAYTVYRGLKLLSISKKMPEGIEAVEGLMRRHFAMKIPSPLLLVAIDRFPKIAKRFPEEKMELLEAELKLLDKSSEEKKPEENDEEVQNINEEAQNANNDNANGGVQNGEVQIVNGEAQNGEVQNANGEEVQNGNANNENANGEVQNGENQNENGENQNENGEVENIQIVNIEEVQNDNDNNENANGDNDNEDGKTKYAIMPGTIACVFRSILSDDIEIPERIWDLITEVYKEHVPQNLRNRIFEFLAGEKRAPFLIRLFSFQGQNESEMRVDDYGYDYEDTMYLELYIDQDGEPWISTLAAISLISYNAARGNLSVRFAGMNYSEGGGVLREFLRSSVELFADPSHNVLCPDPSGARYTFKAGAGQRECFLFGRLVAIVVFLGHQLPIRLSPEILTTLISRCITRKELYVLYPELARTLDWMDDPANDPEDLCLDMVIDDGGEEVELAPGSLHTPVTRENASQFAALSVNYFNKRNVRQKKDFVDGFSTIMDITNLNTFSVDELSLVFSGEQVPDAESLIEAFQFLGEAKKEDEAAQFLFRAIREFSQEELKRFLVFMMSTSDLPIGGWKRLSEKGRAPKISIEGGYMKNSLPRSFTCFSQLILGRDYDNYETFLKSLRTAIECSDAF